jgi:hypothetical protein
MGRVTRTAGERLSAPVSDMTFLSGLQQQPARKGPKIGAKPPVAKTRRFRLDGQPDFWEDGFARSHPSHHQADLRPALWAGFAFLGVRVLQNGCEISGRESAR